MAENRNREFNPRGFDYLTYNVAIIRRLLWQGVGDFAPRFSGRFLDFGCGRKPYQGLFDVDEYVGIDIDVSGHADEDKHADFLYDGSVMPFGDGEFDGMMATEVMEHVFEPERTLADFHRVLKPGGLLLVTTPFVWPEHEVPYDYCRYSRFGLRTVLEKAGFEVVEERKYGGPWRTQCQMGLHYWYRKFSRGPVLVRRALKLGVVLWFNGLALFGGREPAAEDVPLYLSNVFLARKKAN